MDNPRQFSLIARRQVYAAILKGILVRGQACERCRRAAKCEAHHKDYTKPLDVEWLCKSCHHRLHRRTRKTQPDFEPSLRLLVESERYSLTDVGLMFGVSHQRVDQWCAEFGITHPDKGTSRGLQAERVWDDELNRFLPAPKKWAQAQREYARRLTKQKEADARQARKRLEVVAAIAVLSRDLGRTPTTDEMARAVLNRPVARMAGMVLLASYWGRGKPRQSAAHIIAEILAACGLKTRGVGGAGHRPKAA